MSAVLLDTCAFAWTLQGRGRLTHVAEAALDNAAVSMSAISIYEILQKVRIGKWQEMAPFAADILTYVHLSGVGIVPVDEHVALHASTMEWSNRDPFDRPIVATARRHALSVVSADARFDEVIPRIWYQAVASRLNGCRAARPSSGRRAGT